MEPENPAVGDWHQRLRHPKTQLPPANLVFLVDVSGSMESPDKLGLLKPAKLLTQQLRPEDKVAIAVYAGAAGVVLEPTPAVEGLQIEATWIDSAPAATQRWGWHSTGLQPGSREFRQERRQQRNDPGY